MSNHIAVCDLMAENGRLERENAALRSTLVQFVATCDTAPPISLITELGMACSAARAALGLVETAK